VTSRGRPDPVALGRRASPDRPGVGGGRARMGHWRRCDDGDALAHTDSGGPVARQHRPRSPLAPAGRGRPSRRGPCLQPGQPHPGPHPPPVQSGAVADGVPLQLQLAVLHIIDGGTLDRFPELRVGFFEGDVGGWRTGWAAWTRPTRRWRWSAAIAVAARVRSSVTSADLRGAGRPRPGSHGGDRRGRPCAVGQRLAASGRRVARSDRTTPGSPRSLRGGQAGHLRRRVRPVLPDRPRGADGAPGPGWDGATPVSAITGMLSATTNAVAV